MYEKGKPKITSTNGKKSYTQISFIPDFEKFGIKGLTKDTIALFKKRAYDIAMTSSAKVYYNDELILADSFPKYVDLYFPKESSHKKVLDISNKYWKICVVYDPTDKLEHQNISFVNGICTSRGGTHVDHVSNQIINKIKITVMKKAKNLLVKPAMIKENLIFFVDSSIDNPTFDSQTKELLKSKVSDFGSTFSASNIFLKKILKTGVVDQIIANAQAKAESSMGKGNKVKLVKLYDAHRAKKKMGDCTLILTEGDSAKTFAMSGLNVIGRDYYGVFPLKGKLLNVRDESPSKIGNNEEIKAITQIIGLEYKKKYDSVKGLRYGKVMVLTDQDVDGSHIKGLIMNFIHYFWPSLIKITGFICCITTPLLKATKGKGKNKPVKSFINSQSFDEWKKKNNEGKGWSIKYYKGLGTHTSREAQECFEDVDDKLVSYFWPKLEEIKNKKKLLESEDNSIEIYKPKKQDICEDAMTLAFEKGREDDRKLWLNTYNPNNYIDNSNKIISYYDFFHKEFIAFSVYDAERSIPNLMDGLKPGQRKVLYASIKKNIYAHEIKVQQLSGYISENTHYHHGEDSLNKTIIKMAQNFVGSNNINLLKPLGQFGSRLSGGKDAASPRYIFTQLDLLTKKIYIEDDFDILQQQYEDGDKIEPFFYAPIIPMILVNGTDGIGTGYSSKIKPCNPLDICENIQRILKGETPKTMKPWYRNFTGIIEKVEKNKYVSRAKYDIINEDTIHITDLPIGTWTDNYKAFIENLTDPKNKKSDKNTETKTVSRTVKRTKSKNSKFLEKKSKNSGTAKVAKLNTIGNDIKSYSEDCTEIKVSFTIIFKPGKLNNYLKNGTLETNLKLVTNLNLTNMHLFDQNGKIKKYNSYGAILKNFAEIRLELYQKRKDYLLEKWRKEMDMLEWKLKFVHQVRFEEIAVLKKNTSQVIEQLEEKGFPKFIMGEKKIPTYDYLTTMTIIRFTKDEEEKLRQQIEEKKEEIGILEVKTASQIWEEELDIFMKEYEKWDDEQTNNYNLLMKNPKNKRKQKKPKVEIQESI